MSDDLTIQFPIILHSLPHFHIENMSRFTFIDMTITEQVTSLKHSLALNTIVVVAYNSDKFCKQLILVNLWKLNTLRLPFSSAFRISKFH